VKLVIELPAEDFAAADHGKAINLRGPITSVEVKQTDGLLSFEREAAYVVALGRHVATQQGIAEGGPAIQIWLKASEGEQDG
jgi:hypothetical protein